MSSFKQRSDYFKLIATKNKLIAHNAAIAGETKNRVSFHRINDEDELNAACKNWAHFPCVVHIGHDIIFTQPQTGLPRKRIGNHLYFLALKNNEAYPFDADAIEAAYDESYAAMMQFISYMINEMDEQEICGRELFLFNMNRAKANILPCINQNLCGWYLIFEDESKVIEAAYDESLWNIDNNGGGGNGDNGNSGGGNSGGGGNGGGNSGGGNSGYFDNGGGTALNGYYSGNGTLWGGTLVGDHWEDVHIIPVTGDGDSVNGFVDFPMYVTTIFGRVDVWELATDINEYITIWNNTPSGLSDARPLISNSGHLGTRKDSNNNDINVWKVNYLPKNINASLPGLCGTHFDRSQNEILASVSLDLNTIQSKLSISRVFVLSVFGFEYFYYPTTQEHLNALLFATNLAAFINSINNNLYQASANNGVFTLIAPIGTGKRVNGARCDLKVGYIDDSENYIGISEIHNEFTGGADGKSGANDAFSAWKLQFGYIPYTGDNIKLSFDGGTTNIVDFTVTKNYLHLTKKDLLNDILADINSKPRVLGAFFTTDEESIIYIRFEGAGRSLYFKALEIYYNGQNGLTGYNNIYIMNNHPQFGWNAIN
jgi:hypothetical protein